MHGHRNVTAAYGADGFTDEHLQALLDNEVGRVLIAYDRDEAGDRGATSSPSRWAVRGSSASASSSPPTRRERVARGVEDPAGALGELLRSAVGSAPAVPRRERRPSPSPRRAGRRRRGAQQRGRSVRPAPFSVAEPPLASPLPPGPPAGPLVELAGDELRVAIDERHWRIRGLGHVTSFEVLRLNVLVAREDPRRGHVFHVDSLDLYSARARGLFARQAAEELGLAEELVAKDLGRVLLVCEEHAEQAVRAAQQPAQPEVVLSEDEREQALELLKDPGLVERIAGDFERVGVVGEQTNCLVGYLAAVSRKLDRPLAVILQSTSAAGKSALQEAVLAMVPAEERVQFSAMTGQSLFYMGESDLEHKVLAVAEEEGAERAAYALKLLQSEGELSIASTGKEPATGRLVTHAYRSKGRSRSSSTTTAVDVDEELLNRCIVSRVDKDREQTRAIMSANGNAKPSGACWPGSGSGSLKVHQDAQRLLKPCWLSTRSPNRLTFSDARQGPRRDHSKYLTLIRADRAPSPASAVPPKSRRG